MFRYTTPQSAVRELDHRTNDDIDVRLLWDPRTNRVSVVVEDRRRDQSFEFWVSGSDALDAFHHPYAHRARTLLPRMRAT
jgi:hypothetical protein